VEHLNRAEEEGNDLRAPGHLDQPDTQDDGLEIEIHFLLLFSHI
jgi:hypothetical protein